MTKMVKIHAIKKLRHPGVPTLSPNRSTRRALTSLTSGIERDRVFSGRCGRSCQIKRQIVSYTTVGRIRPRYHRQIQASVDQMLFADQIQSLIVDLATIIPNSSQPLDIMAPILTKRGSVSSESSSTTAEPTTWKVLVTLGSAGWITYSLWNSATHIYHWIQNKIQRHNIKKAIAEAERQQNGTLQKRHNKVPPPGGRREVNWTVAKTKGADTCWSACCELDFKSSTMDISYHG